MKIPDEKQHSHVLSPPRGHKETYLQLIPHFLTQVHKTKI